MSPNVHRLRCECFKYINYGLINNFFQENKKWIKIQYINISIIDPFYYNLPNLISFFFTCEKLFLLLFHFFIH